MRKKLRKPRRRTTSFRSLRRKLSGRDDEEGPKSVADFLLELAVIPKCVYPILKARIRKTTLRLIADEKEPTDRELKKIEESLPKIVLMTV